MFFDKIERGNIIGQFSKILIKSKDEKTTSRQPGLSNGTKYVTTPRNLTSKFLNSNEKPFLLIFSQIYIFVFCTRKIRIIFFSNPTLAVYQQHFDRGQIGQPISFPRPHSWSPRNHYQSITQGEFVQPKMIYHQPVDGHVKTNMG